MIPHRPAILLTLALAGTLGITGCDALTSADKRIARASAALEEGRLSAALTDARLVAEKHPERAEGWLLLARIGIRSGDAPNALKDLERAATNGATAEAIRPLRDQALLQSGGYEELAAQEAASPDEQVVKATALAALSRFEEAQGLTQTILSADPQHARARLLQVRMLYNQGQGEAARVALDELLSGTPSLAEGWLLKAQYALADADGATALEAFAKADTEAARQLTLPEQAGMLTVWTETQLNAGQTENAARTLGRLQGLIQQSPVTEYLSARISMSQGDAGTAVATLQRSLGKVPTHAPSRLLLGAALLEQGSVEQARNQLNALIAEQPENMDARRLLARLFISQGDAAAAERVLSELPEGVRADPTADWMRSAILSMSGQRAESLAVLEQAARASPGNVPLQLDLARAYLSAGRRDDAARVLDAVPAQRTGMAGKQLQVLTRIQGQPAEQVPGLLRQIVAASPGDAELRTVVGQFLLQLGDADGAGEQFRSALSAEPELLEARMGIAGVALRKAQYPAAAEELKKVVAASPQTEAAYLALAAVAVRQSQPQEARRWLEQLIAAVPASAAGRMALAELSYQDKQPEQAEALLQQANTIARDKPAALQQAGDIHMQAGEAAKAEPLYAQAYAERPSGPLAIRLYMARRALQQASPEAVLRQWLQGQPGDFRVRTALAVHLIGQDKPREAIVEYERLLTRGTSPVLLNNLAWAYQKAGDPRAEATARQAYEAAPTNPAIADTYGWILLEKGKAKEALPLLEKAAAGLPDNPDVLANLKRAREQVGE